MIIDSIRNEVKITRGEVAAVTERSINKDMSIFHVDIVDEATGKIGRFWISAEIRNGRPAIIVSTQGQESRSDKTRAVVGTWREMNKPVE